MSALANNEGLRASRVCFSYGDRQIIDNITLELKPGTLTALVGPNGAGKSTLLHLLQGRLQRDSGLVECNSSITVMPQRASIDWTFPITVHEMVSLGGKPFKHQPGKQIAKQLLKRVGMDQLAERRLSDLSGGQQQRVLLARALMQQTGSFTSRRAVQCNRPPNARTSTFRDARTSRCRTNIVSEQPRLGKRSRQLRQSARTRQQIISERHSLRSPRKTKRYDMHDGESLLWMRLKFGG
jgi:hypothetical protein